MIGLIFGFVAAIAWSLLFIRIILPDKITSDLLIISYSTLKDEYPKFRLKGVLFYPYIILFSFAQFLIWAIWLLYILEIIRPIITESLESNIVGFIFFQSMIINLMSGIALYGITFKIYSIGNRGVNTDKWRELGLDGKFHCYVFGKGVRIISRKILLIALIYYLILHNTLLIIWG